jgi:hypothetical protein
LGSWTWSWRIQWPKFNLNIYQNGGGNSAVALQTDARNSVLNISQTGGGNGADVGQGSDDSKINLTQNGFGNSATLDQWNSKNSTMNVSQYGGFNGALVDQTASNSTVTLPRLVLVTTRQLISTNTEICATKKQGICPVFFGSSS